MFTRDFSKLRVVAAAVGIVLVLYAAVNVSLLALSQHVESTTDVYPYRDEDWLRYLLPGLFKNRSTKRIMLVGESAVRENLLYEKFDEAFPGMRAFQGGLSLGTMDDLLVSLEYIEQVYGKEALPQILVVGITVRFVANLPEKRPFLAAIENYSPYFGVEETPAGPRLKPKSTWEGWSSWMSFILLKQQKRYLGAIAALARDFLADTGVLESAILQRGGLMTTITKPLETAQRVVRRALTARFRRWASPYKYHHRRPLRLEGLRNWLRAPDSWWHRVHSWNPAAHGPMISDRFGRLREFTASRGIQLFVINLPENVESRILYGGENYQLYLRAVRENLDGVPFLDIHDLLDRSEFYDVVHATLPGARRTTDRVIRFVQSSGAIHARTSN